MGTFVRWQAAAAILTLSALLAPPAWTQDLATGRSPARKGGGVVGSPRAGAVCTSVSLVFDGSTGELAVPPGRAIPIRDMARALCVAPGWKARLLSSDRGLRPSELVGPQLVNVEGVVARGYDAIQAVRVGVRAPVEPGDDADRSVRRSCAPKIAAQLEFASLLSRGDRVAQPRGRPSRELELVLVAARRPDTSTVTCGYGMSGVGRILLGYSFDCRDAEVVGRNTWRCH